MRPIITSRPTATALALAVLATATLGAAADGATTNGYVECAGTAGGFGVQVATAQTAALVPNPPGSSVTSGVGCAAADGLSFAGDLEAGVVDAVTFHLDWMGAGAERGGQDFDVTGTLTIDGVDFAIDVTAPTVGTNDVGAGPITHDVEFTISGLAADLPESSGTRSIAVHIDVPGTGGVPWAGPGLWVWGTSEVPAGITLHEVAPA